MKNTGKVVVIFAVPFITLAAESEETIQSLIKFLISILAALLPTLMVFSFVVFFWGLVKYVYNNGEEKKEQEGRAIMTWGVLAIFVLMSIYGIISWFYAFLGSPAGPQDLHIVLPQISEEQV